MYAGISRSRRCAYLSPSEGRPAPCERTSFSYIFRKWALRGAASMMRRKSSSALACATPAPANFNGLINQYPRATERI